MYSNITWLSFFPVDIQCSACCQFIVSLDRVLSFIFLCNFMPWNVVRLFHVLQFHVQHFQRPPLRSASTNSLAVPPVKLTTVANQPGFPGCRPTDMERSANSDLASHPLAVCVLAWPLLSPFLFVPKFLVSVWVSYSTSSLFFNLNFVRFYSSISAADAPRYSITNYLHLFPLISTSC